MADHKDDFVGILTVMHECSTKLPAQWEGDFWLGSLHSLVELVIETRSILTLEQSAELVGIGGMLIRQIGKEAEALSLVEQVLGRARNGGAHA